MCARSLKTVVRVYLPPALLRAPTTKLRGWLSTAQRVGMFWGTQAAINARSSALRVPFRRDYIHFLPGIRQITPHRSVGAPVGGFTLKTQRRVASLTVDDLLYPGIALHHAQKLTPGVGLNRNLGGAACGTKEDGGTA